MEAHTIWDTSITASDWKPEGNPYKARLNSDSAWQVYTDYSRTPFIQVKLGSSDVTLTGVATQTEDSYRVKSYTLSYSLDGVDWVEYREDGEVKVGVKRCLFSPRTQNVSHMYICRLLFAVCA